MLALLLFICLFVNIGAQTVLDEMYKGISTALDSAKKEANRHWDHYTSSGTPLVLNFYSLITIIAAAVALR